MAAKSGRTASSRVASAAPTRAYGETVCRVSFFIRLLYDLDDGSVFWKSTQRRDSQRARSIVLYVSFLSPDATPRS